MAHSRSRRSGGREIESVRWSVGSSTFLAQSAGTAALNFISAASNPPETLMRMRGNLVASIDGATAPGKLVHIGLGVALVPEGSSTTVTWSPITDGEAPWWFHTQFVLGYEEMVTDVIDVAGLSVFRQTVDLKGMRIIRPDVEAQIVIENVTLDAAVAVNVSMVHRVLFGAT